jgi:hypothetical protein
MLRINFLFLLVILSLNNVVHAAGGSGAVAASAGAAASTVSATGSSTRRMRREDDGINHLSVLSSDDGIDGVETLKPDAYRLQSNGTGRICEHWGGGFLQSEPALREEGCYEEIEPAGFLNGAKYRWIGALGFTPQDFLDKKYGSDKRRFVAITKSVLAVRLYHRNADARQ